MEELIEEAGKWIWSVIRFILWHVLFDLVFFNVGRVVLLAFSLGRFPRANHLPHHQILVGCVGIAVVVGAWVVLFVLNRSVGAA